ncbi:ketosteroid isomerase-like protein [Bradyrhizobium liaoningense]
MRMQDGKAAEVTAYLDLVPYDDVLRRIPSPAR